MNEFSQNSNVNFNLPLVLSNNQYISDKSLLKFINFLPNFDFLGKNRLFIFINQLNMINSLEYSNYDIFHPTYYDTYFLKYIADKPFVVTVHDMIHEKFKELFKSNDNTSEQKKILINKAKRVIAISENTKKDIVKILGVDESKIEVIYHGNSLKYENHSSARFNIQDNYLLYVGTRGKYKNFYNFIKSVTPLIKNNREIYVYCVGGRSFNNLEIAQFEHLGIINNIQHYDLDDKKLAYFYKNAMAFVYPSLYEGFGMPILEAFSCGCPLICSDQSCFPEIAGDAAVYFDPYSECSIKTSISKIIENPSLRKKMIDKGFNQLKKYSWNKAATQTENLYRSIL